MCLRAAGVGSWSGSDGNYRIVIVDVYMRGERPSAYNGRSRGV
jgi:hypothetical protein